MIASPSSNTRRARDAMARYRDLGLNPLPSRGDRKAPKVAFADHWRTTGPDWWLDVPCRNVQVMTGAAWRLAVLDLDGPTAIEVFRAWTRFRPGPPTWEVAHTPSRGRHLWYTLPAGVESVPSRFVWELLGAKHEAIEILGDGKIAIAPPSIHVGTGRRYRFLPGRSPRTIARPAEMPGWMLDLPDVRPRPAPIASPRPTPTLSGLKPAGKHYHSRDVLDAISDKEGLASAWGLRLAGLANQHGWIKCHAVGREDRQPSAGFHERSGYYCEPHVIRLSLFDLAVELGAYASWDAARDDLGGRYAAISRS